MTKSKFALAAALVIGMSSAAFALEGLDGDNNPVPGYRAQSLQSVAPGIYAQDRAALRIAPRSVTSFPEHEQRMFEKAQGLAE